MNGSEKTRLRSQVWWERLRARKIAQVKARDPEGKLRCEITGTWIRQDSKAQCHHRFPDDYQSENLDDYRILSSSAHDFIEWLATISPETFPNREKMLEWLGDFLPVVERKTDKYYRMIEESLEKTVVKPDDMV